MNLSSHIALICIGAAFSSQSMAGEWDYPSANITVTNQQEALSYLDQAYSEVGSYRFRYQTESKLGTHYSFDVLVGGEYMPQRTMVVSTSQDGSVTRVYKSLVDTVLRNGVATVASELEAPRLLEGELPPSLSAGELVSAEVNIFNPDLRTMHGEAAPESLMTDLSQYANSPSYITKPVELLKSGANYYLSNEHVTQVDAIALYSLDEQTGEITNRDSSAFLPAEGVTTFSSLEEIKSVEWQDPSFAQLMAFTHLDHSVRYIKDLGFSFFDSPIHFDGRGLSANNSSYYLGPKLAVFGVGGGSPDALDADVVLHELGHGIHYHIVKDWAYGHTGAIGEGLGDYWAGTYSYRTQYLDAKTTGQEFEIDTVFNWDGYFGTKKGTRSLWNQRARYLQQSEYRAHESVAGELGDELWSTPLFQSLKEGVNRYQGSAFEEFDTIVLESMYGLGRGLKMHDLAQNMLFVAEKLYPNRAYADILREKFSLHGLLVEPFSLEIESKYLHPEQAVSVNLYPTGRQASVNGHLSVDGEQYPFSNAKFDQLEVEIQLPEGKICGQALELESDADYQFDPSLQYQQWANSTGIVYGIPTFESETKQVNSILPDARTTDQNELIVGLKSFNFTVADRSLVVGDKFGVLLDIEHPQLSDLTVILTSPRGTRATLLSHESTKQSGFNSYFTVAHDDAMKVFKGESGWGTWRLEIADYIPEDSGLLKQWTVGAIEQYECGDAAAEPTSNLDQSTSESSGGTNSLPSLLILFLLAIRQRVLTRKPVIQHPRR
ncbi:propeptide, peptidase [Vibrio sp. T187]|uniref:proprotein convertase P-domain-containing protein n=1 Tax=Vibrio TaxID=662 RepID=UPI0010C98F08|nr:MULTISPECIES: proprotein convertase P-domain-containing protein [Vibrio]MBW3695456.1 propeptide, peptidase [Vibrio sp. T187]